MAAQTSRFRVSSVIIGFLAIGADLASRKTGFHVPGKRTSPAPCAAALKRTNAVPNRSRLRQGVGRQAACRCKIAYEVVGEGAPIVLIHGFASNRWMNWRGPGWYDTLTKAGRQVDCARRARAWRATSRMSSRPMTRRNLRPTSSAARSSGARPGRRDGLFDGRVHHAARTARYARSGAARDHRRGRREASTDAGGLRSETIAASLRARDVSEVTDPVARTFRVFAGQSNNDLEALALCMTRPRHSFTAAEFDGLDVPALIVVRREGHNHQAAGSVG